MRMRVSLVESDLCRYHPDTSFVDIISFARSAILPRVIYATGVPISPVSQLLIFCRTDRGRGRESNRGVLHIASWIRERRVPTPVGAPRNFTKPRLCVCLRSGRGKGRREGGHLGPRAVCQIVSLSPTWQSRSLTASTSKVGQTANSTAAPELMPRQGLENNWRMRPPTSTLPSSLPAAICFIPSLPLPPRRIREEVAATLPCLSVRTACFK